jgi:hypothetical protein
VRVNYLTLSHPPVKYFHTRTTNRRRFLLFGSGDEGDPGMVVENWTSGVID